jgi:hypothetical protein
MKVTSVTILALAFCAAGCERFDSAPREAAGKFWAALASADVAAAQALADPADPEEERALRELLEQHPFASYELGETLRGDATALVETRARLAGERASEIAFHTHLARDGAGWRVQAAETRREVVRAALAAAVEDVKASLQESARHLSDAVERGALEFSEALREALEGVERELSGAPPPP